MSICILSSHLCLLAHTARFYLFLFLCMALYFSLLFWCLFFFVGFGVFFCSSFFVGTICIIVQAVMIFLEVHLLYTDE